MFFYIETFFFFFFFTHEWSVIVGTLPDKQIFLRLTQNLYNSSLSKGKRLKIKTFFANYMYSCLFLRKIAINFSINSKRVF